MSQYPSYQAMDILEQLVAVQPMAAPQARLFYMDFVYNEDRLDERPGCDEGGFAGNAEGARAPPV